MAQTTTDNYFAGLLRPVAQRRQRSAVIDPLESQAAMDRATDTQVSNASMPSQGGGGIIQMASNTSGGGTPVRTAQMRDGDEGGVQQTQYTIKSSGGTCRPGMPCYRGPSQTVVNSSPITTTVQSSQPVITNERVISSRPVTTSAPMATTVSEPFVPSPMIPYGDPAAMAASAIPMSSSYSTMPQVGATFGAANIGVKVMNANNDSRVIDQDAKDKEQAQINYDREFADQQKRVQALTAQIAGDTAYKAEETRLARIEGDAIAGETMPGRSKQMSDMLRQVAAGQMQVQTFADVMMRAEQTQASSSKQGGKIQVANGAAPDSPMSPEATQKRFMRMGYSALAVNVLLTDKNVDNLDTPKDTAQVGVTPFMEGALKGTRPSQPTPMRPGYQAEGAGMHAVTRGAVDTLVKNYRSNDAFERSWDEVALHLRDDVMMPLETISAQMATQGIPQGTQRFNVAFNESKREAGAYYNYIEAKLHEEYNAYHKDKGSPNQQGTMTHGQYYGFDGANAKKAQEEADQAAASRAE